MDKFSDIRFFQERDLFIVPFCLLVIYAIAYMSKRRYAGTPIARYFWAALNLRLLFVLVYAAVVQFYYGYGDTTMYYRSLLDMLHAVSDNSNNLIKILVSNNLDLHDDLATYFMYDGYGLTHYYMNTASNYAVPRFSLPFGLLFSGSYLSVSFCLSLFSFAGCWRLFKMFYDLYPALHRKLALAILFLPSVLFWGGSLLKDSICLGCLGFGVYAGFQLFYKRRKMLSSAIILVGASAILFYTKPYILLCILPAVLVWVSIQYRRTIKNQSMKSISGIFFLLFSALLSFFVLQRLTQSEIAAQYSSEKILNTVQSVQGSFTATNDAEGSGYLVGKAGGSVGSIVLLFPLGVFTTLFRPFIWEAGNPLMILSALESTLFLVITMMAFIRVGFGAFFRIVFSDPLLIFCLIFSVSFAGIVGITTSNFGALVRYKIPCIPFYLLMVFIVMHKSGKFPTGYIFSPKFF